MAESKRPWSAPQIIWTAIVTVLLLSAVGFEWFGMPGFGWTTGGKAKEMAEQAVLKRLVEICVAQAKNANAQRLEALAKEGRWQRREFVEKEGWATMPGRSESEYGVAELCAEELLGAKKV